MARARMIARNITKSKKIAQLNDAQRVMYAFILPFLDRDGRINAHSTYLKGHVFLNLEYTEKQIKEAVDKFHDIGLATVYPTEDAVVLEYTNFTEFNKPNHREVASEYPPPSDELRDRPETNATTVRRAIPPVNARATSGGVLGNSRAEVEVEVEVEREVEVEVEVEEGAAPTKKSRGDDAARSRAEQEPHPHKARHAPHQRQARRNQRPARRVPRRGPQPRKVVQRPARSRAGPYPQGEPAKTGECQRRLQNLFDSAFGPGGQDRLGQTRDDNPPRCGRPPDSLTEQLLREAMGDELYADMQKRTIGGSSCGEPSTP